MYNNIRVVNIIKENNALRLSKLLIYIIKYNLGRDLVGKVII